MFPLASDQELGSGYRSYRFTENSVQRKYVHCVYTNRNEQPVENFGDENNTAALRGKTSPAPADVAKNSTEIY